MTDHLPPARIVDRNFDDVTPLYNIQQNMDTRSSDPQIDAIYSRPSEETFIVSLEEQGRLQVNGTASAFRISQHPDYANDPLTALAEYAARLLAHVNGRQGVGWRVENDYTDREIECVIESVEIISRRAEKYEFDYSLTLQAGDGMMPSSGLNPETADPSTTARLAGRDLHEIEEMMITKRQQLRVHTYAMHDFEENEVEALTGAQRDIVVRGSIPGDESYRRAFDEAIREPIGNNETVTFESPFPGEDLEVVIVEHDATREAGQTQIGEYNTQMTEGRIT